MVSVKRLEYFLCAGNSGCGMIRNIDFDKIIVSLWSRKGVSEALQLICLGFFVRSNWIFLTKDCADDLEAYGDTIIKSPSNNVEKILSKGTKIIKFERVDALSKFSIAYVSNSTFHTVRNSCIKLPLHLQ